MELKTQCRERFKPAVDAIKEILKQEENTGRPILVAIDGRCGSGKTTLGEYLKGQLDCNLFHMDDFFLRMEQRTPDRMKETGGNVDYERFTKLCSYRFKKGNLCVISLFPAKSGDCWMLMRFLIKGLILSKAPIVCIHILNSHIS